MRLAVGINRIKLLLIAKVLLLASCHSEKPIAQVGDYSLLQSDLDCREEIVKITFPEYKEKAGLRQLVSAYEKAQILKNFGKEISQTDIQAEKKRIDASSLMPDKLSQIKKACGGDGKTYERAFIVPTIAERRLYFEFFLQDPSLHPEAHEKALSIKKEAMENPKGFKLVAEKHKLRVVPLEVSLTEGVRPVQPERKNPASGLRKGLFGSPQQGLSNKVEKAVAADKNQEAQKWINEIVTSLKPGQVFNKVINKDHYFLIVRLVGPTPNKSDSYLFDSIGVPKPNFDDWLSAQKSK